MEVKLGAGLRTDTIQGATALHFAAWRNDVESTETLLSYGADVDSLSTLKRTRLHIAVASGSIAVSRLLLQNGAYVNARDYRYRTPAIIAVEEDHAEILQELDNMGADLYLRDEYSDDTFSIAACSSTAEITAICREKSSTISAPPCSPLWFASANWKKGVMALLLNTESYLPGLGSFHEVGGNRLITRGRNSLLKMMLKRLPPDCPARTSISDRQPYGAHSPLCVASSVANVDAMETLLRFGADFEVEGHEEGTPLMVACRAGHLQVVEFLVRRGARIAYCSGDTVFNAIEAAERHPKIKGWLLVGRFSRQRKISYTPRDWMDAIDGQPWAGLVEVAVL